MKNITYIKSCAILLHQESIILPQSGWPTFKIHQPPLMVQNIHIYTFNLWFETRRKVLKVAKIKDAKYGCKDEVSHTCVLRAVDPVLLLGF